MGSWAWVVGERGEYKSLDHFVLWFIGVFSGVCGETYMNIVGICRVSEMVFFCCVCLLDPMNVFLWCIQSIWTTQLSILGLIDIYDGNVGSS